MIAIFDHTESTAANIQTFWFKPPAPVTYTAGQYTAIKLPHANADDRGDKRYFTLSSSPSEPLLSITTKFPPPEQQTSTFKQTLRQLQPGAQVAMASPMGNFVLLADKSVPLVFVGGGIGVTPFRSMTQWLADTQDKRQIQLIYGANHANELAFTELFKGYGLQFMPIIGSPDPEWKGETGMLSVDAILSLVGDTRPKGIAKHFYLSGPEPMIQVLAAGLEQRGIEKTHIVTDFFPGYTKY
jgi:glycine betaine catabolism B